MLVERISNPWIKFRITGKDAKEAFLYVVCTCNAFRCDKKRMLNTIVEKCPEVLRNLSQEEIFEAFVQLYLNIVQRGEVMSPAEFDWISQYIRNLGVRKDMEKLCYRSLLSASNHHDETRHTFKWAITKEEIGEIARNALKSNLPSKRKMEIAKEFGEPYEQFQDNYLHKLLWDRHYDKAEMLDIKNDEVVISVILENINAGYVDDAAQIAFRFLPDRQDIADEIQKIKTAIS